MFRAKEQVVADMRKVSAQHDAKRPGRRLSTMMMLWNKPCSLKAGITCAAACALLFLYTMLQTNLAQASPSQMQESFWKPPPTEQQRYTVVMNTWKRHDLLRRAIPHYLRCPEADAVRVVWSESPSPPEELRKLGDEVRNKHSTSTELIFDVHKSDSLNNRFRPLTDMRTDAVLSVDDDLLIPCATLALAMRVWTAAPNTMVGFVPRFVAWHGNANGGAYRYKGWWSVWWHGTYNMVLTKAALFHHKYFFSYTHSLPPQLLDYVHKNRNCEDIAMSFLVANATNAPALWVKGTVNEIGSTGISSLGGHIEKRTECVKTFVEVFHKMPLVETNAKIVDARREILW